MAAFEHRDGGCGASAAGSRLDQLIVGQASAVSFDCIKGKRVSHPTSLFVSSWAGRCFCQLWRTRLQLIS